METRTSLFFPPFRLEVANEQLWRGERAIGLRPKTFAVLRYLVEHVGRLVTKEELLDAVWGQTVVSDTVLKSCIRELRTALGDAAQTPQFIETVHRRGYRFIAPLTTTPPVVSYQWSVISEGKDNARTPQLATGNWPLTTPLVGREAELAQLHRWFEKAVTGQRQIVFVTGEPGIGKTTLVEAFLQGLESRVQRLASQDHPPQPHTVQTLDPRRQTLDGRLWIGKGQCIEQYGAGEAYMPILEALGRLCREPGGERLITLLHQHAPTWLVQMPTLLNSTDLEALQRKVQGATRERMLREMTEALEVITTERSLVLWLEDLHWSDVSTLELLALQARRRERARLLVIGTYRPIEVIVREHPLKAMKQELQLHGQCEELALRLLNEEAVEEHLAARVQVSSPARGGECLEPSRRGQGEGLSASALAGLARAIHQRTEGNPLFMVNVVDALLAQEKIDSAIVEVSIPETIRQMIEQQVERLNPEEQRLLEAASVAGMEFSAAAVAAGAESTVEAVEERCDVFARRRQFLQTIGRAEWPDGTIATRYSFLHALYQAVTYERVPAGRRIHLHRRIGEREEAAYGAQASEIAAALAMHFERGRDYPRAIRYLQHAAERAMRRSAHQEAVTHLTKGLELLKTLPDTPERIQQELALQIALGGALITTKGYSAAEVERAYARARELCQQVKETPQLFWTLWGLWGFYEVRGNYRTSLALAKQLLTLAQGQKDPELLIEAYHALGENLYVLGELASARTHLEQGIALYDPQQRHSSGSGAATYLSPVVSCLSFAALALWPLGYPDQALKRIYEALTLVQELSRPFRLAFVLNITAFIHQYRREAQAAQEKAEAAITLSLEHEFPQFSSAGMITRGWVLAQQGQIEEGIAQIHQGIANHRATGAELARTYWLTLLVEAQREGGQIEEALTVLDEALAAIRKKGKEPRDAELYRLRGELLLNAECGMRMAESSPQPPTRNTRHSTLNTQAKAEAEECFLKAIEIARRQSAKSWELRAVMSLSRLWQQQGKKAEARQMLAEIYGWFTEGFDTADLKEAKALLETLMA